MKARRVSLRCCVVGAATAFLLALSSVNPRAQSSEPITIVVPFSPSSGPDIVARGISEPLSKQIGASVIVENRTGASGSLGVRDVARADPDGHTLLMMADPPFTVNQYLRKQALYDPIKQFSPIGELATGPLVLLVNTAVDAKSAQEFVSYAKQHPNDINYGSPGVGTPQHLAMEFFKNAAGITMQHIPFKDAAGATTALLGGSVSAAFLPIHVALPLPKDLVRILGVSSAARVAKAPDIPTLSEQGFPGFEVYIRIGLLAPAGTPPELVDRYSKLASQIIHNPTLAGNLGGLGLEPSGSSPEQYAKAIAADQAKWKKTVSDAKLDPQD
jgi:tripartite-type tricarboxylate transporter receptor subunit TctC